MCILNDVSFYVITAVRRSVRCFFLEKRMCHVGLQGGGFVDECDEWTKKGQRRHDAEIDSVIFRQLQSSIPCDNMCI